MIMSFCSFFKLDGHSFVSNWNKLQQCVFFFVFFGPLFPDNTLNMSGNSIATLPWTLGNLFRNPFNVTTSSLQMSSSYLKDKLCFMLHRNFKSLVRLCENDVYYVWYISNDEFATFFCSRSSIEQWKIYGFCL